jgi:cysteine desulfurase
VSRVPAPAGEPEVYLDWNATTPPLGAVVEAMASAAWEAWGNPASVHAAGRRARALVEDAREAVAWLAGADARDVVLTSGGTEANNLALAGAPGLVASRLEHPSVTRVLEARAALGVPVRFVDVGEDGCVDPAAVERALTGLPGGSVVALSAVNHETGVVQPVADVARVVRAAGARLHVDAVQAAGRLPREQWRDGDTLTLSAHKLRGPKGIGALVSAPGTRITPVLHGGSQERGLRPGTVDPAAAAGFGGAARHAVDGPARYGRLAALRDHLEHALGERVRPNGARAPRAPHVSNLSFRDVAGDELVAALDLEGVRVSSGSACSAGTSEPSPIILAMLGPERARSAVRVSLGEDTTMEEIIRLLRAVDVVLPRLKTRTSST